MTPPSLPQLLATAGPQRPPKRRRKMRAPSPRAPAADTICRSKPSIRPTGRRPRAAPRRAPCRAALRRPASNSGALSSRSKPPNNSFSPRSTASISSLKREERALDLFDRVALGHHLLDGVDPPHHRRRVEPHRSLVLALAPDAAAARQEAELHVLAEGRLRQLDPAGAEDLDHLGRRHAVRVRALDGVELADGQEPAALVALSLLRSPAHHASNVFHSEESTQAKSCARG